MTAPRASFGSTTLDTDRLIAGELPILTRKVTLASGQNVARGAVLGRITAGGNFTLSASAAVDGSQTPRAIAAEDINASGGAQEIIVYIRGDFNTAELILGAGHTLASIEDGLRALGIYFVTTQGV